MKSELYADLQAIRAKLRVGSEILDERAAVAADMTAEDRAARIDALENTLRSLVADLHVHLELVEILRATRQENKEST